LYSTVIDIPLEETRWILPAMASSSQGNGFAPKLSHPSDSPYPAPIRPFQASDASIAGTASSEKPERVQEIKKICVNNPWGHLAGITIASFSSSPVLPC
jgi:hypothetical protein